MIDLELSGNPHFYEAFLRWWEEDWSWEGLAEKSCRESLGDNLNPLCGTLQDRWKGEQLHKFGGRSWTRFHLPPMGVNGALCPTDIWSEAKAADCVHELSERLRPAKMPDNDSLIHDDERAIVDFPDLRGVVFPDEFGFERREIVGDFRSCIFLCGFDSRDTGSSDVMATFENAIFTESTLFQDTAFKTTARFNGAYFCHGASFARSRLLHSAWFGHVVFARCGGFDSTIFEDFAYFSESVIESAVFVDTEFKVSVAFEGTEFIGNAAFMDAEFTRSTNFNYARFRGTAGFASTASMGRFISFEGARFESTVDFSGRRFLGAISFRYAHFDDLAMFYDVEFPADTDFVRADFRGGSAKPKIRWFRERVPSARDPRYVKWLARPSTRAWLYRHRRWFPLALRLRGMEVVRSEHERDTAQLERAYRELRRRSQKIGNAEYEGKFHALELKTHAARTIVPLMGRLACTLYGSASDYGRSMGRPLVWLAGAWFAFAALYAPLVYGVSLPAAPPEIAAACQVAKSPSPSEYISIIARQFLPAALNSAHATSPTWLRCATAHSPFAMFVLNLAQVIVFITLAALFVIALRRRFRIRDE